MPRVRHFTGGAPFPDQLFLAADRLSCDAVFIGQTAADFSPGLKERQKIELRMKKKGSLTRIESDSSAGLRLTEPRSIRLADQPGRRPMRPLNS